VSTYATVADLEAKWRPLSAPEEATAQILLDEAEAVLLVLVADLADRVTSGDLSSVLVRKVLTDAVRRSMGTPSGVQSQTVGPESVTYFRGAGSGDGWFTEAELALLGAPVEGSVNGYAMGSIRLARPRVNPWCGPRVYPSEQGVISGYPWC
jgi:hypothetical protein